MILTYEMKLKKMKSEYFKANVFWEMPGGEKEHMKASIKYNFIKSGLIGKASKIIIGLNHHMGIDGNFDLPEEDVGEYIELKKCISKKDILKYKESREATKDWLDKYYDRQTYIMSPDNNKDYEQLDRCYTIISNICNSTNFIIKSHYSFLFSIYSTSEYSSGFDSEDARIIQDFIKTNKYYFVYIVREKLQKNLSRAVQLIFIKEDDKTLTLYKYWELVNYNMSSVVVDKFTGINIENNINSIKEFILENFRESKLYVYRPDENLIKDILSRLEKAYSVSCKIYRRKWKM